MNFKADKVMSKMAIPILTAAAILIVLLIVSNSKKTNDQNNAYIRVINCIISKNAATRVQGDIEECYMRVERDLDTKLQRYDNSK